MSNNITVSESGMYYYIMTGPSDLDCWPQRKYPMAAIEGPLSAEEEIIIGLCEKIVKMNDVNEAVLDIKNSEGWDSIPSQIHRKIDAALAIANKNNG